MWLTTTQERSLERNLFHLSKSMLGGAVNFSANCNQLSSAGLMKEALVTALSRRYAPDGAPGRNLSSTFAPINPRAYSTLPTIFSQIHNIARIFKGLWALTPLSTNHPLFLSLPPLSLHPSEISSHFILLLILSFFSLLKIDQNTDLF